MRVRDETVMPLTIQAYTRTLNARLTSAPARPSRPTAIKTIIPNTTFILHDHVIHFFSPLSCRLTEAVNYIEARAL